MRALRVQGLPVRRMDCGGGLGIGYRDEPGASPVALAGAMRAAFAALDLTLMVEPGRWLAGPAGVLPSAYTERLMERTEGRQDPAAHAFLDLFSHRALALFYAAWRKYRFPFGLERGERRGFTEPLLALAGSPFPPAGGEGPERLLARSAGAPAQRQVSASALAGRIGAHFGVRLGLESFVGRWIRVPDRDQARLVPGACGLGGLTVLGRRLWDRQTGIRIRLGPLSPPSFRAFLPGAPGGRELRNLVQASLGHALACDLTLVPAASAVPPPVLRGQDAPRLGCDLWLAGRPTERERDDARFRLLA